MSNGDGTVSYQSRSKQDVPLELLNIAEKKRFMDGEKVCCFRLIKVVPINLEMTVEYFLV